MEHLDIYRIDEARPPIIILQYPTVYTGDYVLAAPFYPEGAAKPIQIITPRILMGDQAYLLGTHLLAGISAISTSE